MMRQVGWRTSAPNLASYQRNWTLVFKHRVQMSTVNSPPMDPPSAGGRGREAPDSPPRARATHLSRGTKKEVWGRKVRMSLIMGLKKGSDGWCQQAMDGNMGWVDEVKHSQRLLFDGDMATKPADIRRLWVFNTHPPAGSAHPT